MNNNLGNKEVMAKNIQYYMDLFGKSRNDMCEALGVKYTTFTDWVKANSYPRIDKIEMMANYFGIDKSDLVEAHDVRNGKVKSVRIPVLGRVQAGLPIEAHENILDWEEIEPSIAIDGDYFGLQVKGDSMEPKFSEGDVVIIRKQEDAECGNIVIAMVNGDDATIKKLIKYEDGGIALVASNPIYPPLRFTGDDITNRPVTIIGKVVELRAKF